MNLKQFAEMLNGREYGNEIMQNEIELAGKLGFVVVYGYSDDESVFKGAINDYVGSYDGGDILVDASGVFQGCRNECKYSLEAEKKNKLIRAVWSEGEYAWQYETDIPHETFDIFEDGEKYCKGIVFDIKSLE